MIRILFKRIIVLMKTINPKSIIRKFRFLFERKNSNERFEIIAQLSHCERSAITSQKVSYRAAKGNLSHTKLYNTDYQVVIKHIKLQRRTGKNPS